MTQEKKIWDDLEDHRRRLQNTTLASLYDSSPHRARDYRASCSTLTLDYSRNFLDDEARACLFQLVTSAGLQQSRDAMVSGAIVNHSEQRAALHTALRSTRQTPIFSKFGQDEHPRDERPTFIKSRQDCKNFTRAWRSGEIRNANDEPLTHIVHVGIGGSELGTRLLVDAVRSSRSAGKAATNEISFISDMDYPRRQEILARLDPSRCLFLLVSKSFRTEEMLHNARAIYAWMRAALGKSAELERHFVAITAEPQLVQRADIGLNIPTERIFLIPEGVGGRYSVWSAVSLSAQLLLGSEVFEQFLRGAECADEHFLEEPLQHNIPVIMALLGVWYRNFWDFSAHAIIPYDYRLRRLPEFLQQLEMESGGKHLSATGKVLEVKSSPLLWGGHGTNVQHSIFQWLHQGSECLSLDFFLAAQGSDKLGHTKTSAHCLAQIETLMRGAKADAPSTRTEAENLPHDLSSTRRIAPYCALEGNRPSNLFLYRSLSPHTLGMLLAFYEHKVFVQSLLWKTNPFDQWGVEVGKTLAKDLLPMLEGDSPASTPSLRDSIELWQAQACRKMKSE